MLKNRSKKTVFVGMSGGVDSSVAAALLLEQGYNVVGATLKLWRPSEAEKLLPVNEKGCCSIYATNDAKFVCEQLGIPHTLFDFRQDFNRWVMDNFVEEYLKGRTPNPCIICNTKIKWESFLRKARSLGGDFIATGHYARVDHDSAANRFRLLKSTNSWKDQSYALWGLSQDSLAHTIFPVGELTKEAVRSLARQFGLKTAEKPESQEICFVPDNDYSRFIRDRVPASAESLTQGEIRDTGGKVLGKHSGYPFYTIGQRKGLGIAAGEPVYVSEIRPETNEIIVGRKEELFRSGLIAGGVNWIAIEKLNAARRVFVKIRYKDPGSFGRVEPLDENKVQVTFEKPQRAVTPGQSVVFYEEDVVLGGGVIQESIP
ncbi:tRNA-specific 2-thiouridylase MnmA [bacterium BMS3Bbin03]|nr:tRNA-specific 2-thiouridylase MnmA [bacterium BMS3Bbin03]HDZ10626.1 tRNA 2-thiouridine(34) synthase MnmA [Bacteroidota bacterium]